MVAFSTNQTCDDVQITPIQPAKSSIKIWLDSALKFLKEKTVAAQNRRATQHLLYASDGELADIGLTRDDLYVIKNAPFFRDPSKELQRRASLRRSK